MASVTDRAPTLPPTTPTPTAAKNLNVLAAIHNIPRRMRSGQLRAPQAQTRARGKENVPPGEQDTEVPPRRRRRPAPLLPNPTLPGPDAEAQAGDKWAPKDGQIIIKVWVPTTDDIWKVRVPADVGLAAFRARVRDKVGFEARFSAVVEGRLRTVDDEGAFRRWVAGRVREGRNTLLTVHRTSLI
ncbi:hypothetical protein PYCCODRAFT_1402367 [Trametes coccinea BRFM310]|uniref:Uncharacterized protein n=1 Tax=Trametes coccinea (strain BRFM310) TaxID=1353009 RepID=A0A1Y2J429_TRAC3|nr:hypothetical protein PYCCODRAFT_1402367 [Trametes coccinea BRFM310]